MARPLRDVTELPVIGTVSLIHNEARTQKNEPVSSLLLRRPGWSVAYGLGIGILMFLPSAPPEVIR